LLASFAAGGVAAGFEVVGRCVAEHGIWIELSDGTRREIEPRGFDHFS
jgi:hypothetical protein